MSSVLGTKTLQLLPPPGMVAVCGRWLSAPPAQTQLPMLLKTVTVLGTERR